MTHHENKTQAQKIQFWQKLNRKPMSIYLRYQRLFAKYNNGKWIRGCTIDSLGTVKYELN